MDDKDEKTTPPEGEVSAEFRKLGANLRAALKHAWASEERQLLQAELQTGLLTLSSIIKDTTTELTVGPTGQKIKAEVDDLRARAASGELEKQVRTGIVQALHSLNTELEKVTQQPEKTAPAQPTPPPASEAKEEAEAPYDGTAFP